MEVLKQKESAGANIVKANQIIIKKFIQKESRDADQ